MQNAQDSDNFSLFSLETCRAGQSGCPNALYDVKKLAEEIKSLAESKQFGEKITKKCQNPGPVLFHHRFQACLAGCPNACSQPQIKDFGVTGQRKPGRSQEECIQCLKCIEACQEEAIKLETDGPVFDYNKCVNCGQCQMACPTATIITGKEGLKVTAGGKLGRHPKLAETMEPWADENQSLNILEELIEYLLQEGKEGERLGSLLARKPYQNLYKKEIPR